MKYNIKVLSEAIDDIDEAFLCYELNRCSFGFVGEPCAPVNPKVNKKGFAIL